MILFGQDQQCRTACRRANHNTNLRSYLIHNNLPNKNCGPRTDLRAVQLTITNHNCKCRRWTPGIFKPGNMRGMDRYYLRTFGITIHMVCMNYHITCRTHRERTVTWNMLTAMGKNLQPQRRRALRTTEPLHLLHYLSKICHRQMKSEHTQKVRLHL